MTAFQTGAALILLAAFAYAARTVLAFTPVRPSPTAALAMGLCAAIGLGLFIIGGLV